MRVVAGYVGGRKLQGPPSVTRPTTDKVRGALFNALQSMDVVEEAAVLDLFAGTGAIGVEALSRGASSATFVDNNRQAIQTIKANLNALDMKGEVVCADALKFLEKCKAEGRDFDLVIADPPYSWDDWSDLLALVSAAIVVCESDREIKVEEGWELIRTRKYGDTTVTIFEMRNP